MGQINSYTLPKSRDTCNKILIPTIFYPFVCLDFNHKCGCVTIDMTFQQYLPKCILEKYINNINAFQYVETNRDDNICTKNDVKSWVLNDDWKKQ